MLAALQSLIELQRWLHHGALEALKNLDGAGMTGVPGLIATAFGFGLVHALLPGHGKSVLTAYYFGEGRLAGAIGASAILIATHVGSAIVIVLGGFAVLERTITGAGRAPTLEAASQGLIAVLGLWLLWHALRPQAHEHGRSGSVLAFVTGLVPCPLTTFIMTYALRNGLVGAGLVLATTFALGMIVTVAAFPLLAILFRNRLLSLMKRTEAWRDRVGRGLEIGAALFIVLLGLWPLLPR